MERRVKRRKERDASVCGCCVHTNVCVFPQLGQTPHTTYTPTYQVFIAGSLLAGPIPIEPKACLCLHFALSLSALSPSPLRTPSTRTLCLPSSTLARLRLVPSCLVSSQEQHPGSTIRLSAAASTEATDSNLQRSLPVRIHLLVDLHSVTHQPA